MSTITGFTSVEIADRATKWGFEAYYSKESMAKYGMPQKETAMTTKVHEILQKQFMDKLKDLVPPALSFTDELSEVLKLSKDSVYRRIRCETSLSLEEITALCKHFKVTFDMENRQDAGSVTFYYERLNTIQDFALYLKAIHADMQDILRSQPNLIQYTAVDIPIFHHFQFEELTAFKIFYWVRSILSDPVFRGKKFIPRMQDKTITDIAADTFRLYCQIPSVEVWTQETILSHIRQIQYCWESGLFRSADDALQVCDQTRQMFEHIELQAEFGEKQTLENQTKANPSGNFKLYYSEIGIGNNCITTLRGKSSSVYLSFHTINKLFSTNSAFCSETQQWIDNIIHKSTLISEVAEKTRFQFFQRCYARVTGLENIITQSS